MSNVNSISVNKLMKFCSGKWVDYEPKLNDTKIKLHCDQLIIHSGLKVLETLNMNNKIKGIFKGDVLILVINCNTGVRKLRFQIKSNLQQSLQILGHHFVVQGHNSKPKASEKYRNLEDVLKYSLENREITGDLPTLPAFNSFVKICLLDPAFGNYVQMTKEVLDKL